MIVNLVMLEAKPECVDEMIEICRYNHENSVKEEGNVRFDVLQNADEPCKFTLYEVFRDKEAIEFHKTTEHYQKWAEAMEHILAAPRYKISNTDIAFT